MASRARSRRRLKSSTSRLTPQRYAINGRRARASPPSGPCCRRHGRGAALHLERQMAQRFGSATGLDHQDDVPRPRSRVARRQVEHLARRHGPPSDLDADLDPSGNVRSPRVRASGRSRCCTNSSTMSRCGSPQGRTSRVRREPVPRPEQRTNRPSATWSRVARHPREDGRMSVGVGEDEVADLEPPASGLQGTQGLSGRSCEPSPRSLRATKWSNSQADSKTSSSVSPVPDRLGASAIDVHLGGLETDPASSE